MHLKLTEPVLKAAGIVVVAILIFNLLLAAFRVTSWTIFWSVIAIGGVFAYVVLPKLKQR